jgi:hypothetical protein
MGEYQRPFDKKLERFVNEMVPAAILGLLDRFERLQAMRTQVELVGRPSAAMDICQNYFGRYQTSEYIVAILP